MSTYSAVNPSTGETIREFDTLDSAGIEAALAGAQKAYDGWRSTPVPERAAILIRAAQIYRDRADELARTVSQEMGKPLKEALGEVELSAAIFEYYGQHGPDLLADEPLDVPGAHDQVVRKAAIGVLLGVMPWNFPHYQVARFAGPNLMLGNTIVLKHASNCPLSALLIEEILIAAGLPDHAYVNVFVTTDQVADIIADDRIQGVSLTGSERAGSAVAEVAGRNLKKVVLELGGSDPFIVLDAPDIDQTVKSATRGRLSNTGQACNGAKRYFVMDEIYDEFVGKLTASYEAAVVGDPLADGTTMGPLSTAAARDGVLKQVKDAVSRGAKVLTGGSAIDGPGAFMEATLLAGDSPEMRDYSEEIFGPVGIVYRVADADEAVQLANTSSFGLSGSVWSGDLDRARTVADRLEVGMAFVNEHGTTLPGLPFGGVKRSGFGRELGPWGMNEFVNHKLIRVSSK